MSYYSKILEFNQRFNVKMYSEFAPEIFDDEPFVKLRYDLINEETNELSKAISDDNKVEILDAVCDILYTTYGAAVCFGIPEDDPDFNVEMPEFIASIKGAQKISEFSDILCFVMEALRLIFDHRNLLAAKRTLACIIHICNSLAEFLKVDIKEAFDLVHESNMSKLCISEDEAIRTVDHYKDRYQEGLSVYKSVDYKASDDGKFWIVYNKENDKVLKSINYHPVDLSKFFN